MTFPEWRNRARAFLAAGVRPYAASWDDSAVVAVAPGAVRVPRRFLAIAASVACHRSPDRWALLYSVLYRLTHGIPHLLEIPCDGEVIQLYAMEREVGRDVARMQSFVRFRKVALRGQEEHIAWHRPDHHTLELAAPWFVERFRTLRWTLLTPDRTMRWDQSRLRFGAGVAFPGTPDDDELEQLWRRHIAAL
jgi:DNA polymerase